MLAAVRDESQKAAARVFILVILIKMSRKLFNAARYKSDLHLRRTRIRVVPARFCDLVLLLALREHARIVAYSLGFCKFRRKSGLPKTEGICYDSGMLT